MFGRLLTLVSYLALALLILAFVFANRAAVDVALFPTDWVITVPLYVALAALFALGLLLGLLHSAWLALRYRHRHRQQAKLIAQLESEMARKPTAPQLPASQ